jgi:hypothetical protein
VAIVVLKLDPNYPIYSAITMNDKIVEDPKLVIVYFASGTVQWVKSGSTNQWAREGGKVHKFFESRVYHNAEGKKIKIKQHFKLLNTVFMDVETGAFLDTVREDLLGLSPDPNEVPQHCKWWDVDWVCPIVFEPKPERKPVSRKESASSVEGATSTENRPSAPIKK